jgi:hypothetical protein
MGDRAAVVGQDRIDRAAGACDDSRFSSCADLVREHDPAPARREGGSRDPIAAGFEVRELSHVRSVRTKSEEVRSAWSAVAEREQIVGIEIDEVALRTPVGMEAESLEGVRGRTFPLLTRTVSRASPAGSRTPALHRYSPRRGIHELGTRTRDSKRGSRHPPFRVRGKRPARRGGIEE